MNTTTTGTGAGALIIMALSALVSSGLLGAGFVALRRFLDSKIGVDNTRLAVQVVGEAVKAAEQIGKVHGYDAEAKYRIATDRASAFLNDHGIYVGPDQMRTLVESAVTQIKQANAAATMPGVVATGDSPTINAAPPAPAVPPGPTPEQIIAAITTAIAAVYPPAATPDPAPVPVAPIAVEAVPMAAPTA